jgi:uncharacterized repeat protein (TIGR03803 family)
MKLNRIFAGSLALLALSNLNLTISTAFAQTNRVGVITVSYTMTGSGSGSDNGNFQPYVNLSDEQDQLQISLTGQVKYAVSQTQTNLIIGPLISSSAQQTVSGFEEIIDFFISGQQTSNCAYVIDSAFNPTNVCVILTNAAGGSGPFSGTCEGAVVSLDGEGGGRRDPGWGATIWPWSDWQQGLGAVWHGEDEVCQFQFALTNPALPWSQTLATNTTVGFYWSGSSGTVTSSAVVANTVMLHYVPDQLAVPFTADPTNGLVPLTVQFSCTSLDSGGNLITNWNWSFGDGTTNASQAPSHTYTNTNTFSVTLTAVNTNGSTIRGLGPSNVMVALPTASFAAWPTNGFIPLPVSFTGPAVDSGGNALSSWSWSFGDGATSTDQNPAHIYIATTSKTFSPKLTVINAWGTAIAAVGPKIAAAYPPITFTASPTNGLVPLRVTFSAPAVDRLGAAITNWQWKFGDSATSQLQNPSHTYTNVGLFSPTLMATNVNKAPVGAFGPTIGVGCVGVYTFGASGVGYSPVNFNLTNSDGVHPQGGLALSGNRLYGVMSGGGNGGSGTLFAVNTDGSNFTNLYNFSALAMAYYTNSDGATPKARLVLSGNTLYGAAPDGGAGSMGGGTVFKINTDGSAFTDLHNFGYSGSEGQGPNGVVVCGNTIYGTTEYGGTNNNGMVFKLNTDGSGFTALYAFSTSGYDSSSGGFTNREGAYPEGPLLLAGDSLYGTATEGGSGGAGTVFKLDTNGTSFTVLHSFTNGGGLTPRSELLLAGNTLYGTTYAGGSGGYGTVFKLNTNGSGFATLHSFSAIAYDSSSGGNTNSDGASPSAGLLLSGSALYGTTQAGGIGGSGTIFAVNTNGTGFTNLYSFSPLVYDSDLYFYGNLEGANPYAGLALVGNMVYCTTCNGGDAGDGTIFAFSLVAAPPALNVQCNGKAVVISWPSTAAGFVLQQNSGLTTAGWTTSGLSMSDDGTTRSVTITAPPGNLFFRLAKQ